MDTIHLYLDQSNSAVQVTVPSHQLEQWDELAEQNNMSRSMFVRACVEAGRKQLAELDPTENEPTDTSLESNIINVISEENGIQTDDLVEKVLEPVKDDIYDEIEQLDEEGRISFSPREGGYVLK